MAQGPPQPLKALAHTHTHTHTHERETMSSEVLVTSLARRALYFPNLGAWLQKDLPVRLYRAHTLTGSVT